MVNKTKMQSSEVRVKVKKLHERSVLPTYAHEGDGCMDITAVSINIVEEATFGYVEYGTGLAFGIPSGYVMEIYPRSSISNTGLILVNSPCQIDSGFKGEVMVRFKWVKGTKRYDIGDRIAQIKVVPYPKIEWIETEDIGNSDRGDGAFGSTGN